MAADTSAPENAIDPRLGNAMARERFASAVRHPGLVFGHACEASCRSLSEAPRPTPELSVSRDLFHEDDRRGVSQPRRQFFCPCKTLTVSTAVADCALFRLTFAHRHGSGKGDRWERADRAYSSDNACDRSSDLCLIFLSRRSDGEWQRPACGSRRRARP